MHKRAVVGCYAIFDDVLIPSLRERLAATRFAHVQVGVFPFDHKEHLDPNTTAAYMEVWLQQVQTSFSELPHIQEQIAKEVRMLNPAAS